METKAVIDHLHESMRLFIHGLRMKGNFNETYYNNACLALREVEEHFRDDENLHKDLVLMFVELPILVEGSYGLLSKEDQERADDGLMAMMDLVTKICTH